MSWGCLQEVDVESGARRTWELSTDSVSVGRLTNTKADDKLTIKWSKAFISGHHFSIKRSVDGTAVDIFDYSSNGTFVNATLIGKGKSCSLKSGDVIQLRFKQVDNIVLTFHVYSTDSREGSGSVGEHPSKRKRVEADPPKNDARGRTNDSNLSTMKISGLEKDIKQQEARIEAYIAKLETSARENSNLIRDLKVAQDDAEAKGQRCEDLQQQCSVQESHSATVEARSRKLEESLQAQKLLGEKLRSQLALSEERSAQTKELLLKVETLSDELTHRKSQSDARSTLCDELTLSLETERKQKENIEHEFDICRSSLEMARREVLELKCSHESLQAELLIDRKVAEDSRARVELLEGLARRMQSEEGRVVSSFRSHVATITASIGQLQRGMQNLEESFPSSSVGDAVESCFLAMQQLPGLITEDQQEKQQQEALCTQVLSPERMVKTISGESSTTVAFSRNTEINLDCTQTIGTSIESADISKIGCTNPEYRQCSVYDSISLTEDEIDVEKLKSGSLPVGIGVQFVFLHNLLSECVDISVQHCSSMESGEDKVGAASGDDAAPLDEGLSMGHNDGIDLGM